MAVSTFKLLKSPYDPSVALAVLKFIAHTQNTFADQSDTRYLAAIVSNMASLFPFKQSFVMRVAESQIGALVESFTQILEAIPKEGFVYQTFNFFAGIFLVFCLECFQRNGVACSEEISRMAKDRLSLWSSQFNDLIVDLIAKRKSASICDTLEGTFGSKEFVHYEFNNLVVS
jgi:hypothetical protein